MPLTPDGFLPLIDTKLRDYAGTIGIRGTLGGWKTDLSIGRGHDSFDYQINDSLNTSFGTASKHSFDAGGLRYGQTVPNLDLTHEYAVGFAKPLSVAVGAEYRGEDFKIRPGELQSYAIGPLFRPAVMTTAANCTTQQGVYNATTGRCSFSGAPLVPERRASRASPRTARPTSIATAMPVMSSSTPILSRG